MKRPQRTKSISSVRVLERGLHRIHAHVVWRVLGLWLERGIAQACGNTRRHIRVDMDQRKLVLWLSPHGEV
jgi:hypothetical protein